MCCAVTATMSGRDFGAIVRSTNFNVVCEETEADVEDRIDWIKDKYRPYVAEDRLEALETMYRRTGRHTRAADRENQALGGCRHELWDRLFL